MGKYGPFPGAKGRAVRKILEQHCGDPVKIRGRKAGKGSHLRYQSPYTGLRITWSPKDSEDVDNGVIKRTLVKQLGLTEEEAREALK